MMTASTPPAILFTAFEPSGDAHAAPVIRRLREIDPTRPIYAWGGPLMHDAGATLIQTTVDNAAMGLSAIRKVREVRREKAHIKRWSKEHRVAAVVAVDSPAANFPICKVMKKRGARVINLVAPQVWAWAPWRIRKVRRLTDLVLCLLPFEEQYFNDRKVPARFIGHPRINRTLDMAQLNEQTSSLPHGSPRVAILPGSRPQEVRANLRLLVNAFDELQGRFSGVDGVIVAANDALAEDIRRRIGVFPNGLHMVTGQSDAVIHWSTMALAVSGTITLDLTAQRKPMVGVYKISTLSWMLSKVLLRTPYRLLPNIIAQREIVPEFVPYAGGIGPIVKEGTRILNDTKVQANIAAELDRVCHRYANKKPDEEAARLILNIVRHGTLTAPPELEPASKPKPHPQVKAVDGSHR